MNWLCIFALNMTEEKISFIQKPVTEDKTTISTPLATSWNFELKTSTNEQPGTKTQEEAKNQENAEELPWKLPVIIGATSLVVLALGATLLVFLTCRRRRPKIKPRTGGAVWQSNLRMRQTRARRQRTVISGRVRAGCIQPYAWRWSWRI